jgi:hypothetical protein
MTYSVNTERPFQARNAKAYEVEILSAPSRIGGQIAQDRPRPIPLPEQEWLLNGRPVDRVVGVRDGEAARIVVPDPRWFALQKLWMAEKPERNPQKKPKDYKQGMALLDAVWLAMPHYLLCRTARCVEAAFRIMGCPKAAAAMMKAEGANTHKSSGNALRNRIHRLKPISSIIYLMLNISMPCRFVPNGWLLMRPHNRPCCSNLLFYWTLQSNDCGGLSC